MNKVQQELMKKALAHRNYEAMVRLDNIEQAMKWKAPDTPFPVYKKADNIKNNLGWRNLLRSIRP